MLKRRLIEQKEKGAFSSPENRKIKSVTKKRNLELDNQNIFELQNEPNNRKIKEILKNLNERNRI